MVKEIKDTDFKSEVEDYKGVVLIDFWAPWCGPCKMAAPIIENVSKELANKAKVVKVNVDENRESSAKFGVMSIPTFLIMKNGKEVERMTGVQNEEALKNAVNKVLRDK